MKQNSLIGLIALLLFLLPVIFKHLGITVQSAQKEIHKLHLTSFNSKGKMADSMQEELRWASELPGGDPPFCRAARDVPCSTTATGAVSGLLLAAAVPSQIAIATSLLYLAQHEWAWGDLHCL